MYVYILTHHWNGMGVEPETVGVYANPHNLMTEMNLGWVKTDGFPFAWWAMDPEDDTRYYQLVGWGVN